jgi:hypothetical protein
VGIKVCQCGIEERTGMAALHGANMDHGDSLTGFGVRASPESGLLIPLCQHLANKTSMKITESAPI